jgi:hypothetical protein
MSELNTSHEESISSALAGSSLSHCTPTGCYGHTFLWQCLNPSSREAQDGKLTSPWDHRLMAQNLKSSNNRNWIYKRNRRLLPVTVASWFKAWTVFARLDAGIVGSNPTHSMDVWCMRLFRVCVVLCLGSGLATGWSLVQEVLPSVKNDYGTE